MKQKEFNQQISTYWWNFGTKKNDFNGKVSEFLINKGVKVCGVKHPNGGDSTGIRFRMPIGSSVITYDDFGYAPDAALTAVKLFLTYLGDRAQIKIGSRTININN